MLLLTLYTVESRMSSHTKVSAQHKLPMLENRRETAMNVFIEAARA